MNTNLLSAFFGALFGAICTYLGAILIDKRRRRFDANARLIAAFLDELAVLKKPGTFSTDVIHLLQSSFDKHYKAVIVFKGYLAWWFTRMRFNSAWENYYTVDEKENKDNIWLEKYSDALNKKLGGTVRSRAIQNIERILAFAKYK